MSTVKVVVIKPFNHGLHLVFDILTCGAWFPFHVLIWILTRRVPFT